MEGRYTNLEPHNESCSYSFSSQLSIRIVCIQTNMFDCIKPDDIRISVFQTTGTHRYVSSNPICEIDDPVNNSVD